MSYYDVPPGNADIELGRHIYMGALSGRRGFRDDQLGIEDEDIWAEIFEDIGKEARVALGIEVRRTETEGLGLKGESPAR